MPNTKVLGTLLGFLLFVLILICPTPEGLSPEGKRMAAVTVLMIVWWITEAIPIYITAFVPVVLFPLLGILNSADTTVNYGHDYVLMLLGAFILAKGIEKQHLHSRIALNVILLLGTQKRKIILGFMLATAFLSMWITNMAVVLIMLPIAAAIINEEQTQNKSFGIALLLGVAYSASIGGTGTLIGTPPNLVFAGLFDQLYPEAPEIGFVDWMYIAIPLLILFLPIIWLYIIYYFKIDKRDTIDDTLIKEQVCALGKIDAGERRMLYIFIGTALGWIFRKDIALGDWILSGWGSILGISEFTHDSTVALFGAIVLFLIGDGKGSKLMDWKSASKIPWGVAMFLGGGLALGAGFKTTGLALWLGERFTLLNGLPTFWMVAIVVAAIVFITEVNSNTATATIFLPILATMGMGTGINPLLIMVPATFACSFAFMLPSGTGTNTVIFASGKINIADMARAGLWLNLLCIVLLPLLLYFVVLPLAGVTESLPVWAK
ncbi:MAG: SLC13 family permease [Pricia sp.]